METSENQTVSSDAALEAKLDELLGLAREPELPAGFCDRVMAALPRDKEESAGKAPDYPSRAVPGYKRTQHRLAAAVACFVFACTAVAMLAPLSKERPEHSATVATPTAPLSNEYIDDTVLLDAAMESIEDSELVYAICCVSSGNYSVSTTGGKEE